MIEAVAKELLRRGQDFTQSDLGELLQRHCPQHRMPIEPTNVELIA